jgi:ribosomal protein S18 acetylase RimI-like enzyme
MSTYAVATGDLDSCTATKLTARIHRDPYCEALYHFPIEIIAKKKERSLLVWVVEGTGMYNKHLRGSSVAMVQSSPSSSVLIVLTDDPKDLAVSLDRLATELWQHGGESTRSISGFEPYVSTLVTALRLRCYKRFMEPRPARAIEKRMWWIAGSAARTSSGSLAPRAELPAGAVVDEPKSDADYEALAWIECQNHLHNDPCMTKYGLTERIAQVREFTSQEWGGVGLVVARDPGGAVCAAIWTIYETGATIELHQVGTLPSHHGRGYAAGILTKLLEFVTARGKVVVTLRVGPSNKAAIACYRKVGFVDCGFYSVHETDMHEIGSRNRFGP